MTVVKSNAYGHGLVPFAQAAARAGTDWFGVDNIDEALELRRAKITQPILVLGYTPHARLIDAAKNEISITVYNRESVFAISKLVLSTRKPLRVHVEIETGITRQGLSGKDLLDLAKSLQRISGVFIEGAFTHFANIEDTTDSSYAELQLKRFKDALGQLAKIGVEPTVRHTACSAAAILFPQTYFNLARVGISSYGLWPSKETQAVAKRMNQVVVLYPVLTWKTMVAQIKSVQKGTPISYGLTERVQRDSKVAVIPVGYWDGFDRGLSSIAQVLIRGRRCKVLGRICMNMCMVDVTDIPSIRPEDEVVLLGAQGKDEVTAEEIAGKIGTINYEVVTRINPQLRRDVVA